MCATYPTHLILLYMVTLIISGNITNYEAPHCALSSSCLLLSNILLNIKSGSSNIKYSSLK
jgi:hypothetical protein